MSWQLFSAPWAVTNMGLKEYKAKRNFSQTSEPIGRRAKAQQAAPLFVVQKHDATRLHYDLRLEMEGVLKSWAVPKGFPWKKGEKHLAVQVEDHPFDYRNFEGIIPEGNYGAGTVMLWDTGTYRVGGDDPLKALNEGKLHLFFSGRKLRHEWTLIRLRKSEKQEWLLLKSGGNVKSLSKKEDDQSVTTGRTMSAIAADADKEWKSNRPEKKGRSKTARVKATEAGMSVARAEIDSLPIAKLEFVEPMKARTARQLPRGSDWVYEIKFDGVRAIAIKDGAKVRLCSRAGNEFSSKYPEIESAVRDLSADKVVLDGEIAALDEQGRSSFQLLQAYHMAAKPKPPLIYYVFDALNLEGRDLSSLPLHKRKEIAQSIINGASDRFRFSPAIDAAADRVVSEMRARGLEGLVAKQKDSTYQPGKRSGVWLKYKWVGEQEFVIGGYTRPKGSRSFFGALLVGYYDRTNLIFAGKVGTGFDEELLRKLFQEFKPLVQDQCPFSNLPERRTSPRGGGLTASQMRLCTWIKPMLVAQVKFAEWTRDGLLRQPCFVGLREDKSASEVIREQQIAA